MAAPTPDSLQGPGFVERLGNFLSGRRNEQRGRPEMVGDQWRVPKYDENNRFIGYGTLDPQLDRRWNPGKLQADLEAGREKAARAEVKSLYETAQGRQWDVTNRQLNNQTTALQNSHQLDLARLQQQIAESQSRTGLAIEAMRNQREATQDANELNRYSIDQSSAVSREGLALKGIEMQANIALQQQDMAFRQKQLDDLRGSRKLAFISKAMESLLA